MIKEQLFLIVNKNGDVLRKFYNFNSAKRVFLESDNPNYVSLIQKQVIERDIMKRKVNSSGNAIIQQHGN